MLKQSSFLLLGSGTNFTCQVLQQLLSDQVFPQAYVHHGSRAGYSINHLADIPVVSEPAPQAIESLLKPHHIDHFYQNNLELAQWIRQQDVDFLLVACWPELISMDVINSVNCAALNLHPSLLPAYRGFDPIRDQINAASGDFGVSLHLLNEQFDCGDIVLQQAVGLTLNESRTTIESLCAQQGAKLFQQAMQTYFEPGWSLLSQC